MAAKCLEDVLNELHEYYKSNRVYSIANFINNAFVAPQNNLFLDSFNPSKGVVWAKVPDSSVEDVNAAVEAAKKAFAEWSSKSPQQRSKVLMRIADIVERHIDMFALFESLDQLTCRVVFTTSASLRRAFCTRQLSAKVTLNVPKYLSSSSLMQHEPVVAVNYVTREPLGVAGLISPWNLPLYLLSFKIAPALAAGNTVVAKPSEMTSVTAYLLGHAMIEAGLPPGVVNLVFGTGPRAGEALVVHADVPLISFTGSTLVGRKIQALTAPMTKKLSLEMGGKNACIVFDDVDIEKALPVIVRSCFANQGEICLCTSRLFVHKAIFDKFLTKFVEQTRALIVGAPLHAKTNLGALVSEQHMQKVQHYMRLAQANPNVTVHCGGIDAALPHVPNDMKNGYFLAPTVLTGVERNSALMLEEIFGPVVCVMSFANDEEAVELANDSEYGLSASLWSQNVNRVHKTAHRLKVGTVWCNCWLVRELNMPFGGTKASGVGRESAEDSLDFFTEKKTICIKMD